MSSRRLVRISLIALVVSAVACGSDRSMAPTPGSSRELVATTLDLPSLPGSRRPEFAGVASNRGGPAACSRRDAQIGSAIIGASGGTLTVGRNQLIVPAGALDAPTLITASVPADTIASIHFEPEGLQFRKPAGLVLDADGCSTSGDQAAILYIGDDGTVLERIDAIYSTWWHTVAAPISHFSVYAIGI